MQAVFAALQHNFGGRKRTKKTAALAVPPKFREETSKKQGAEAPLQAQTCSSQVQHASGFCCVAAYCWTASVTAAELPHFARQTPRLVRQPAL
jgi:hypothetical protein